MSTKNQNKKDKNTPSPSRKFSFNGFVLILLSK